MTELSELHKLLVYTVINFYEEKGLPADANTLAFTMEDLASSVDLGDWHASSDSYCALYDRDDELMEESV